MSSIRQYKNIVSFKDGTGKVLGFHSENLDMAELDNECWEAFENKTGEAFEELQQWEKEINPDSKEFKFKESINQFSINIAQVCNLACTYCAADGGSYGAQKPQAELDVVYRQLTTFLKPLKNGDDFQIRFFGGEPLLYPKHIEKIADYANLLVAGRNIKLLFRINTNATLIDEDRAKLLAKYKMAVAVSIDGPEEINDKYRPSKDKRSTTSLIKQSLETLEPYRSELSTLRVITVFGEHNLKILETYEYLKQFNFNFYSFSYARSDQDKTIMPQFISQLKWAAQEIDRKYGFTEIMKIYPFRSKVAQLKHQYKTKSGCGAGKNLVQADTNGKLFACNWFMNDKSEVIGEDNKIFSHEKVKYKKNLVELHGCESCWARNLCGGGCMYYNKEKNGDKHIKDPYYCDRSKAQIELSLGIYHKYNHRIN